jgi:hypothetical protein
MRTFFYSVKKSNCGADCQWRICPQRYLAKLRTLNGLKNIRPVFGEVSYVSPSLAATPRNGDIVIMYVENTEELDIMISLRAGFEGLKKILVMADSAGIDGDRYHMLAPRFITQVQRNIAELEAVIQKMIGRVN